MTSNLLRDSKSSGIEVLEAPQIQVVPFAVSSSKPTTAQDFDHTDAMSIIGDKAVVGTTVILNNAVMVWVGWGNIDLYSSKNTQGELLPGSFGTGTTPAAIGYGIFLNFSPVTFEFLLPSSSSLGAPIMGPVVVSMPRTNYKGAFGTGSNEPSCSQIIGSASSDDQMLASQMASRLTTRSGLAVFVSCQLSDSKQGFVGGDGCAAGMDSEVLAHRAAALAEKEVSKILLRYQKLKTETASTTGRS